MRLILCFFCFFISVWAKSLNVEVSARSAILMNAETGAILYEKHPHIPSYPASITKIATALFVLDHKRPKLEQLVTVSQEAVKIRPLKSTAEAPPYWGEVDGTKMGLLAGEVVSFDSLLHGLLLISGNDAANVLAENVSSSIPQFTEEMNQYIRSLGCVNTQFRNPHGLHHPEHVTTAYDIALIAKKALQVPKFREVISKVSYMKPKTNKNPGGEIRSFNALIKSGPYYYPKAIGGKTGNHSHAMRTLVSAAEHEGRVLIAVLLGCAKNEDRYQDAIRLFEAAFQEQKKSRVFLGPEQTFSWELEGAETPLRAGLKAPLELSFYPAEEPVCKAFLHWDPVELPIRKGQKVGEAWIQAEDGALLQKGDLIAKEAVEGKFFFRVKQRLSRLFSSG